MYLNEKFLCFLNQNYTSPPAKGVCRSTTGHCTPAMWYCQLTMGFTPGVKGCCQLTEVLYSDCKMVSSTDRGTLHACKVVLSTEGGALQLLQRSLSLLSPSFVTGYLFSNNGLSYLSFIKRLSINPCILNLLSKINLLIYVNFNATNLNNYFYYPKN